MNRRFFLKALCALPLIGPQIAKGESLHFGGLIPALPKEVPLIYGHPSKFIPSLYRGKFGLPDLARIVALPPGHEVHEIFIDCKGGHDPLLPGVRPVIDDRRDDAGQSVQQEVERALYGDRTAYRSESDFPETEPSCQRDSGMS